MVDAMASDTRAQLLETLERSRELGFLGPGDVSEHLEHALGFVTAWHEVWAPPPVTVVDLGSGGGVPALVCATVWAQSTWTLVESQERRSEFLRRSVGRINSLRSRVRVVEDRAEVAGRLHELREHADLVTARSFAPPPVTAECASPFLRVGGSLIVSEPPDADGSRWSEDGLVKLGMAATRTVQQTATFQVVEKTSPCPATYPRRVGVPRKRPVF